MEVTSELQPGISDVTLLKLAREIAMDIRPLEGILETLEIKPTDWE